MASACPVWPFGVGAHPEGVEDLLCRWPVQQRSPFGGNVPLNGPFAAFNLALGLRIERTAMQDHDAQPQEPGFQPVDCPPTR